uniref:Uncharacterized protein n=1 Tax=Opuntia streptacantha TaxID=393608 RepID=A0A7C9DZ06_OPUST
MYSSSPLEEHPLQQKARTKERITKTKAEFMTNRVTTTPWLKPFFCFGAEFEGTELGFEGTFWAVAAESGSSSLKEQVGNGEDPHISSLPRKLFSPNFRRREFGRRPKSSLLDKLRSLSWFRVSDKSGIRPEKALFSSRRVIRRVRLDNSDGNGPRRLLSERSSRRSRRREPNSGGMSPEKSL